MQRPLLLLLLLSVACPLCQAQIPNNGFESWTNSEPVGWGTLNPITAASSVFTAEKGVPGFPGTGYLSLTSRTVPGKGVVHGVAVSGEIDTATRLPRSGFPFASRPQELRGAYQYMIFGGDFGFIHVYLTKWNTLNVKRDTIAKGQFTLAGMAMSWSAFLVGLNYQSASFPDSALIILSASGTNAADNDYLWVDNLSFSGSVATSVSAVSNAKMGFEIFPNPATEKLSFNFTNSAEYTATVLLSDLNGRIVFKKFCKADRVVNSFSIQTGYLPRGSYILRLITSSGTEERLVQMR